MREWRERRLGGWLTWHGSTKLINSLIYSPSQPSLNTFVCQVPCQILGMSVVPKATLRFDDSGEGFTELRIAVIFMFMVYYSKRVQFKISKGRRYVGHSPEETNSSS